MERHRSTRPPIKQEGIVDELRCRILDRTFAPGSRLPTRSELQQRFQVSSVTIQRALDRLVNDGFVQARGRQGTFVTDHPPHSFHYGLVFPMSPGDGRWVRFWTALGNEAQALQRGQPRTVSCFYGIDGHSDTEDYQRLVRDIRNRRLAGLFFATTPFKLVDTPVMLQGDLPRVGLVLPGEFPGVVPLVLDTLSFLDKALDYFHARGRKRVALFGVPGFEGRFQEAFVAGLAKRGMRTKPYWSLFIDPGTPQTARNCAQLLMHADQGERPDGLFIADDNLVEYATAGLIAVGVRVPDDCHVVAHCNFPWPTPSVLPVKRLGYDARYMLELALDAIDRQRRGEPMPGELRIPAQFEDEIRPVGAGIPQR